MERLFWPRSCYSFFKPNMIQCLGTCKKEENIISYVKENAEEISASVESSSTHWRSISIACFQGLLESFICIKLLQDKKDALGKIPENLSLI